MKKKIAYVFKCLIFLAILVPALMLFTKILEQKYLYDDRWPSTTTTKKFYDLEPDSVDVLFMGSSRSASTFIPQELYNNYGIRSYNLGTQAQSVVVTYYWLKEALRTQTPKAVVMESYMLFEYRPDNALNSEEPKIRAALDNMQWGGVKQEAIHQISLLDEEQDEISYYLPYIRYHSRWTDLGEDDFDYIQMEQNMGLMGYSLLDGKAKTEYEPLNAEKAEDPEEKEEFHPLMIDYFSRIVQLCKEQNIQLILVTIPYEDPELGRYNTLKEYTDRNEIDYYDFNTPELYTELGMEYGEDMEDSKHCNYQGARKLTNWAGKCLTEKYGIEGVEDPQWEQGQKAYKDALYGASLQYITDYDQYIDALKNYPDYTVFIGYKGDRNDYYTKEIQSKLKKLGLKSDLTQNSAACYYAIIDQEEIQENFSVNSVSASGSFRDGRSLYSVTSASEEKGNTCSIIIDGEDESPNKTGLNIVVYDNFLKRVVDSVCFAPKKDGMTAKR
ncbi:MAG: hypothetical protein HUJ72_05405 [Blautia sp.]|nr:hypothetical protein [Blautia sp.]